MTSDLGGGSYLSRLAPTQEKVGRYTERLGQSISKTVSIGSIYVESVKSSEFLDVRGKFRELASRAAWPNVFSEPAVVAAAADSGQRIIVLLAWTRTSGGISPDLAGAWPLIVRGPSLWRPVPTLLSPLNCLCYVGGPVLDRTCAAEVLRAFFSFLDKSKLPKLLTIGDLYADPDQMKVFEEATRDNDLAYEVIARRRRAKLQSHLDGDAYLLANISAPTRKKLSQKLRRMQAIGEVRSDRGDDRKQHPAVLEEILSLERKGWKGQRIQRGRAILFNARLAGFVRGAVRALGEENLVALQTLRINGELGAAQILLYSGFGAFTWLTTYDEDLSRCSPGIQQLQLTTKVLLDDPRVTVTDSCNTGDYGYMAELWKERMDVIDIMIDVRPGSWLGLRAIATVERLRRRIKSQLRTLYRKIKSLHHRVSSRVVNKGLERS